MMDLFSPFSGKHRLLALPVVFLLTTAGTAQSPDPVKLDLAHRLVKEELTKGMCFPDLEELCRLGSRLTGSDQAQKAVAWGEAKMKAYGFDRVWLQPVTVPKWTRGKTEKANLLQKGRKPVPLTVCALGLSPGTPAKGLEAGVIEVQSLKEADSLGGRLQGKIVFFNRPFDESLISTFACYGGAADQRSAGPSIAGKHGAVAVLVRSMTNRTDDIPHTGMVNYQKNLPEIPAAALSTRSADLLSSQLKTNPDTRVRLTLDCRNEAPVTSWNVIGEIRGTEFPDEIILTGGHLDSWDLGTGAHDDGAGCVQSIEVLRVLKSVGYKPRRTLRAVLFMSEEVGGIGGKEYGRIAEQSGENHIAAIESDRGGFTPRGHSIQLPDSTVKKYQDWVPYFSFFDADKLVRGGGGVDISPLEKTGTHLMGYTPDSQRYFDHHHAATDVIGAVNPRELKLGAAAMAVMVMLIDQEGRK